MQDSNWFIRQKAHSQVLHLPLYPSFTLEEQDRVMEGLFHVIKQEIGVLGAV
ncbi:hypothetical protein L604_002500000250 [Bacillus subtilis J27]|nr:hypothetical protein L604_002500000250 [Bacillus subtilis J27]